MSAQLPILVETAGSADGGSDTARRQSAPKRNKRRVLRPMPLLDEEMVLERMAAKGIKTSHAYTLWRKMLNYNIEDWREVENLPKEFYKLLDEEFALTTSKVVRTSESADGSTTKLMVELQDGKLIEAVIMRYGSVPLASFPQDLLKKEDDGSINFKSKRRATLCISSQVGCQMGCTFCATGTMGLVDNLSAGEILEQLYHANKIEKIRNVVFMGMGEPLDNYGAVMSAVRAMTDARRFSLAANRITISTVGVVPRLKTLAIDAPGISLALSLHAPTQELRMQIVPTSKAWHIDRIIDAVQSFLDTRMVQSLNESRHRVVAEYVLIADINDSEQTAHDTGRLLQNRSIWLNLIPYNPTAVPYDYKPPSRETVNRFGDIVRSYDVNVMIRQELGQDIDSACGQLVVESMAKKMESGKKNKKQPAAAAAAAEPGDLEDLMQPASAGGVRRREVTAKKEKAAAAAAAVAVVGGSEAEDREKKLEKKRDVPSLLQHLSRGEMLAVLVLAALVPLIFVFLLYTPFS